VRCARSDPCHAERQGLGRVSSAIKTFVKDHAGALAKLSGVLKGISFITGVLSFIPIVGEVTLAISMITGGAALAIDGATMWANGKWNIETLGWDSLALLPAGGQLTGKLARLLRGTRAARTGAWAGEGLSLAARDNALVDAFLTRAANAESGITPKMQTLVDGLPGSRLDGLDYRLKGPDSLKRKVATDLADADDAQSVLGELTDSVRYTVTADTGNYTATAQAGIDRMRAAGFEPVDVKNNWSPDGYQGVNSVWRDPVSGHTFEVQFHTPQSLDAKMATHPMYEELRLPGIDPARAADLIRQQNAIFARVPIPPGAQTISLAGGVP